MGWVAIGWVGTVPHLQGQVVVQGHNLSKKRAIDAPLHALCDALLAP